VFEESGVEYQGGLDLRPRVNITERQTQKGWFKDDFIE
jgi:hypothetical protein